MKKTTVATIYGRILKELGFLSKGNLVTKTASDFIGRYVEESQTKTASVLEMSRGRVLLIDEAYNLDDDRYGKQVLDTIVEKVMGSPGEDIAVILVEYKPQMLKMLQHQNPGLTRRFDPLFAIEFQDFSDSELLEILSFACNQRGVRAPIDVKWHMIKMLTKRRALANFGNASAVKTLLSNAIEMLTARERKQQQRVGMRTLTLEDVDPNRDDDTDTEKALSILEGFGSVERELRDLGKMVAIRRQEKNNKTTNKTSKQITTTKQKQTKTSTKKQQKNNHTK